MPVDEKTWKTLQRKFLTEMKTPIARRELALLSALSKEIDFAIGCYCEDETRCHRSILRELLEDLGASFVKS